MKVIGFILLSVIPLFAHSDRIHLDLAVRDSYDYISELLIESLESQGHRVTIDGISNLPHQRVMKMLESGDILSLHWRGQSPKWDSKFTSVEVDLTNGLKGHRVLFIPEKKQQDYDGVRSLDDFRNLNKIGGFGSGWSDIDIWKANRLAYYEVDGEWNPMLYKMLAANNRGIDYFSRGIIEIGAESLLHPYLEVEKNLVLIYKKDFRIYLSHKHKYLKSPLEKALKAYKKSGEMDLLIRKHYPGVFDSEKLNLEGRKKIHLEIPFD